MTDTPNNTWKVQDHGCYYIDRTSSAQHVTGRLDSKGTYAILYIKVIPTSHHTIIVRQKLQSSISMASSKHHLDLSGILNQLATCKQYLISTSSSTKENIPSALHNFPYRLVQSTSPDIDQKSRYKVGRMQPLVSFASPIASVRIHLITRVARSLQQPWLS